MDINKESVAVSNDWECYAVGPTKQGKYGNYMNTCYFLRDVTNHKITSTWNYRSDDLMTMPKFGINDILKKGTLFLYWNRSQRVVNYSLSYNIELVNTGQIKTPLV